MVMVRTRETTPTPNSQRIHQTRHINKPTKLPPGEISDNQYSPPFRRTHMLVRIGEHLELAHKNRPATLYDKSAREVREL